MTIRRITIAAAIPDPIGYPTAAQPATIQHTEEPVERSCFTVRPNWNEGPDGPQPTCSDYQHAH